MHDTFPSRPVRRGAGAASLVVAAALLLSACGGGDSASSNKADKVPGADTGTKTAAPSASASADGIERPDITLPKDVKNVFEGWQTGDPQQDAVLADSRRHINAIDAAVTEGTPQTKKFPAVDFYTKDAALLDAYQYIASFYKAGQSFSGTARYYNQHVKLQNTGAASVTYCADETTAYTKDRKTGKVEKGTPSSDDYILYNTQLKKNTKGVWQTVVITSDGGAKACQR
ncbi:hypothetical protein OHB13_21525 [Streptomyces sp. NBC_00440]|uniref:hypothetical protein n=1 Tax=Streptomyces sp. NBC_00440 TaxID=2975741 RepID=UPI002E216042